MAAGASSSLGRPSSCKGTPAPAVAHRATFSFRRRVARRRRPLHHCRRPGRCRPAMHRIQRPHWRPCRGAPLRPPRLMTAGGRICAHPAQMAPAHHGVEHIVCGLTTEKWSPRLIASSTLFVDATAVLPKIPHVSSCRRVPNRPLRPRRGRFRTLLQLLQCGIFGRTAVDGAVRHRGPKK